MIDFEWVVGFIGGILLSISMLPQLRRMWKERRKRFEEISVLWLVISIAGSFCMLLYGFMIEQPSMIILNSIGLFSFSFMTILYYRSHPILS